MTIYNNFNALNFNNQINTFNRKEELTQNLLSKLRMNSVEGIVSSLNQTSLNKDKETSSLLTVGESLNEITETLENIQNLEKLKLSRETSSEAKKMLQSEIDNLYLKVHKSMNSTIFNENSVLNDDLNIKSDLYNAKTQVNNIVNSRLATSDSIVNSSSITQNGFQPHFKLERVELEGTHNNYKGTRDELIIQNTVIDTILSKLDEFEDRLLLSPPPYNNNEAREKFIKKMSQEIEEIKSGVPQQQHFKLMEYYRYSMDSYAPVEVGNISFNFTNLYVKLNAFQSTFLANGSRVDILDVGIEELRKELNAFKSANEETISKLQSVLPPEEPPTIPDNPSVPDDSTGNDGTGGSGSVGGGSNGGNDSTGGSGSVGGGSNGSNDGTGGSGSVGGGSNGSNDGTGGSGSVGGGSTIGSGGCRCCCRCGSCSSGNNKALKKVNSMLNSVYSAKTQLDEQIASLESTEALNDAEIETSNNISKARLFKAEFSLYQTEMLYYHELKPSEQMLALLDNYNYNSYKNSENYSEK